MTGVIDERYFPTQHVNEFILAFVPVATRRVCTGVQHRVMYANLCQTYVVAEPSST